MNRKPRAEVLEDRCCPSVDWGGTMAFGVAQSQQLGTFAPQQFLPNATALQVMEAINTGRVPQLGFTPQQLSAFFAIDPSTLPDWVANGGNEGQELAQSLEAPLVLLPPQSPPDPAVVASDAEMLSTAPADLASIEAAFVANGDLGPGIVPQVPVPWVPAQNPVLTYQQAASADVPGLPFDPTTAPDVPALIAASDAAMLATMLQPQHKEAA